MPKPYDHDHESEVVPFAKTNFRGQAKRFGIKTDDRRRHIYIVGKTGMGKTTLIENMVVHDINAGHGVAYIDPHGDTADKLLDFIPPHRINDVVYFNPADREYPIGFNILEVKGEDEKHLVAAGLMGVFKKIWEGVWSPRMEYILLNCVLAMLDVPGATMMGIARILADKEYRAEVVDQIKDPVVKSFWVNEFAGYSDRFASEAVAPIQNKVGQFLSAGIIRNIVAQTKSTFNLREIMDERKILIANLAKGSIGEDSSRLLGGMLITRVQLAAMERVDMPESERQDYYLYVDEFQNFATESFANILSEARKYRLNLITAHQYIEQLDETVAAAIFGNVGTIISFRVGAQDAEMLAKEYAPVFTEEDVINLAKFEIYLKLMIDGVASSPFSAATLPPIAQYMDSREKVVRVSRERYTLKRDVIEEKVTRWSEYMKEKPKGRKDDRKGPPKGRGDDRKGPPKGRANDKPLPPPPKPDMFAGNVRVVTEAPDVGEKHGEGKAEPKEEKEKKEPAPKKEGERERKNAPRKDEKRGAEKAPPPKPPAEPRNPPPSKPPAGDGPPKEERRTGHEASDARDPAPPPPLPKMTPPPAPSPAASSEASSPSREPEAKQEDGGTAEGRPPQKKKKKRRKKKRPHDKPLPPPPEPGAFTGKVRIAKEEEKPEIVFKKDESPGAEEVDPKDRKSKSDEGPGGPKPLRPGESVEIE